jgi:hypothetical protein
VGREPAPGGDGEPAGDRPPEGEWLTVAAAARRLGVSPRAIRSRIERGTLRWKAAGNSGKLVFLASGEQARMPPGDGEGEAEDGGEADLLREELAEARVALARIEERAAALRETLERERAEHREALERERTQHREALEREQARADRVEAELRELRRPWWQRLWSRP